MHHVLATLAVRHQSMLAQGATRAGLLGVSGLFGVGGAMGLAVASRVGPTELPQTVAAFHSLVGLAAAFTGIGEFIHQVPMPQQLLRTRHVVLVPTPSL